MSCTCKGKGFLHLAHCPVNLRKEQGVLKVIKNTLLSSSPICAFYISQDENVSVERAKEYKLLLRPEDWIYDMQLEGIITISMNNFSELTFLPQSEALFLIDIPKNSVAFLENFPGFQDISDSLRIGSVSNISIVDAITNEAI